MKKKRRIIALLLTACMLCSMLISPSYAVGTISATDDPSNGNSTAENTESDIDLPDIIKDSEFDNSGYVGRITENEPDLNTFVFDNGLNENSIYVISVSSGGQTEHEFVRSYNISITESS